MAAMAAARTKRRPSVLRAVLVPGELPMGDAVLGGRPDGELAGKRKLSRQKKEEETPLLFTLKRPCCWAGMTHEGGGAPGLSWSVGWQERQGWSDCTRQS